MVSFPNCKINLGLNVVRRRADGYHDIETIFYPLPVYDVLEIITVQNSENSEPVFTLSGLPVDGGASNNLCMKAYMLLKKDFPGLPAITMHLHKAIPLGAGLAGGSADGAFTLQLLNKKFQLQIAQERLLQYALQLGSDCPFFIFNQPCFATGRGEQLQPLLLNFSGYKIMLIHPGIHISTQWAFSQIIPQSPVQSIKEIINQPIETWRHHALKNDFEQSVLQQYPELLHIRNTLYDAGALYAAMSGSGSSFYGIFPEKILIPDLLLPQHYFVRECIIK